jgi:hypothetical protein
MVNEPLRPPGRPHHVTGPVSNRVSSDARASPKKKPRPGDVGTRRDFCTWRSPCAAVWRAPPSAAGIVPLSIPGRLPKSRIGGLQQRKIEAHACLAMSRYRPAAGVLRYNAGEPGLPCEDHMNGPTQTRPAGPVVGLDAIGELFGQSRYTIRRWIEHQDFPASRLPDGSWTTSHSLIDGWLMARAERRQGK